MGSSAAALTVDTEPTGSAPGKGQGGADDHRSGWMVETDTTIKIHRGTFSPVTEASFGEWNVIQQRLGQDDNSHAASKMGN